MKPVFAPTTDVNSDTFIIAAWHVDNRSQVAAGQHIADIETSKAVFEVSAPEEGFLLQGGQTGMEVPVDTPLGFQFTNAAALSEYERSLGNGKGEKSAKEKAYRATAKAEALALQHGIDLAPLYQGELITQSEVEKAIHRLRRADSQNLPSPLAAANGVEERIILIGAGMGASQILDILGGISSRQVVALVDDDPQKWGQTIYGLPVTGGTSNLETLLQNKQFDSAIVSISTSIPARVKYQKLCADLGIPLANAIDPTCKIGSDVTMGKGNVLCAFCHIGTGTVIGDNNFLSAYNSFDHHSEIGSNISTGPNCVTSAKVKIGDRVRMGTGIFIEPYLELGEDVQVASGAIILKSVPAHHAVKTKVITTTVTPLKN